VGLPPAQSACVVSYSWAARHGLRRNHLVLSVALAFPNRTTSMTKDAGSMTSMVSRPVSTESPVSHGFLRRYSYLSLLPPRTRLQAFFGPDGEGYC
jgi:hypothetical protein